MTNEVANEMNEMRPVVAGNMSVTAGSANGVPVVMVNLVDGMISSGVTVTYAMNPAMARKAAKFLRKAAADVERKIN